MEETVRSAIQRLAKQTTNNSLVVAKVKSVNESEMICDCEVAGEPDYLDCRLMSTFRSDELGYRLLPKIGSYVILGFIDGNEGSPCVLCMSEIENIDYNIEGKFSIRNKSKSLKKVLEDILATIETLTVSTSTGASGTPLPPTIQKLTTLKKDVSELLKD